MASSMCLNSNSRSGLCLLNPCWISRGGIPLAYVFIYILLSLLLYTNGNVTKVPSDLTSGTIRWGDDIKASRKEIDALTHRCQKTHMRALTVIGSIGRGKTHALQRLLHGHHFAPSDLSTKFSAIATYSFAKGGPSIPQLVCGIDIPVARSQRLHELNTSKPEGSLKLDSSRNFNFAPNLDSDTSPMSLVNDILNLTGCVVIPVAEEELEIVGDRVQLAEYYNNILKSLSSKVLSETIRKNNIRVFLWVMGSKKTLHEIDLLKKHIRDNIFDDQAQQKIEVKVNPVKNHDEILDTLKSISNFLKNESEIASDTNKHPLKESSAEIPSDVDTLPSVVTPRLYILKDSERYSNSVGRSLENKLFQLFKDYEILRRKDFLNLNSCLASMEQFNGVLSRLVDQYNVLKVPISGSDSISSVEVFARNLNEAFVMNMVMRSLILLERKYQAKLRLSLLQIINKQPSVYEKKKVMVIQKNLRELLAAVEALRELANLGKDAQIMITRLSSEIAEGMIKYAENFTASPVAQLKNRGTVKEILKLFGTSEANDSKSQKGIQLKCGLTGMIRGRGYGNLQGFANYSAGPFTLTLGYANDRDSIEARHDGSAPSILKVQPKLSLDLSI